MAIKCALWLRVSDASQSTAAQRHDLMREVEHRGLEVVCEFDLQASAYNGAQEHVLAALLLGAQRREYQAVVVYALDRLDRRGTLATLEAYSKLTRAGCDVISVKEPYLNDLGSFREPMVALLGWIALQESTRRSERIKSGLAKRKAAGLPVGRQPGSTDKTKRRRSGYHKRWESSKQTMSRPAA